MAAVWRRAFVLAPNFCKVLNRTTTTITSQSGNCLRQKHLTSPQRRFCSAKPLQAKETVRIIFVDRDGDVIETNARVGQHLLDVALDNDIDLEGSWVTLNFQTSGGELHPVKAKVGDNLLDVIIDGDVEIDGFGACEGTLACSTCHLIFKQKDFDKIPEKPTDEELDMLDLAYGLTDTSRLGCQVIVTKDMDGWEVAVPDGVADARDP